jgi:hypothetical protein
VLWLRSVLPVVILMLAACGPAPETTAGLAAPSSTPGEASTLTHAPGATGQPNVASGAVLPPDLANFPVPPHATPMPLPARSSLVGRWAIEPGSAAYRFLRDALPAAGYSITWLGPGDTVAIIRFEDRVRGAWQVDIHGDLESAVLELGPEHP